MLQYGHNLTFGSLRRDYLSDSNHTVTQMNTPTQLYKPASTIFIGPVKVIYAETVVSTSSFRPEPKVFSATCAGQISKPSADCKPSAGSRQ
jgi:hypothetical protein